MTFPGGGLRGGAGGAGLSDARESVESALRDRPLLRRIAGLFRPYRRELWGTAVLIVVASGLGVVGPLLVKVVFDKALFVKGGPNLGLLYGLLALIVAATVVGALVGIWQSYLTNTVGHRPGRTVLAASPAVAGPDTAVRLADRPGGQDPPENLQ